MYNKQYPVLPFTKMKNKKWSFLYAYNIRVIRDIFVYCAFHKKLTEKDLYLAMDKNLIPPPKNRWVNPKRKKKDRTKLEYIHAAKYLGFIKTEDNFVVPDYSTNSYEKKIILDENKSRRFEPSIFSPPFTEKEKNAILKIVLNYERARDFLRWFLDFKRYPDIWSFNEEDFRRDALPIYMLLKIKRGKKGREILKREIDGKIWRIPDKKPHDYTRIASFVFPNWFKELGLIDRIIVFPEFSMDKNPWCMYYPIKIKEGKLTEEEIKEAIFEMFFEPYERRKTIWIPLLLFKLVKKFYCAVDEVKKLIVSLYKQEFSKITLERASLEVMKYAGKLKYPLYRESFIKVDGFYRSYLIISR